MGICWFCYWGWPVPVADIYKRAVDALDGYNDPLHFGPSHIVWDDENFGRAKWCLDHFDEYCGDYSNSQLAIVKRSLKELDALPNTAWDVEPEDYDGQNPQNYPPTCEMERV